MALELFLKVASVCLEDLVLKDEGLSESVVRVSLVEEEGKSEASKGSISNGKL